MQNGEWRGLLKGSIAEPHKAFGYVSRAFKQHTSAVMGAFAIRSFGCFADGDGFGKALCDYSATLLSPMSSTQSVR